MTRFSLAALDRLTQRPLLFAPGDRNIWTDPHIASQMLLAHLNPDTDAASRRPETIDRTVAWLLETLRLPLLSPVVDLGCGPGLYCERLARAGLRVTGVDYSSNSIAYARRRAEAEGLEIEYRLSSYLEMDFRAQFDAALLIYYDFCPLPDASRDTLLARVWLALAPGGRFIFDVLTPAYVWPPEPNQLWEYHPAGGFWSPNAHLVLHQHFDYPDEHVTADQYIVVEPDLTAIVYRVWSRQYTLQTLEPVLRRAGFAVESVYTDLTGAPYDPYAPSLAVIARKI